MNEASVTIRTAKVNDYETCLLLFKSLYHGDIGPDFRQTFIEYATKEHGIVLIAERSTKLVGILVGSFHLDIDWEGTTARIDAVIVDETQRREGIGTELAQHFLAKAKRKGCKAVKSRVNIRNTIAQRFHEKIRFTKAETYEYMMDL